MSGESGNVQCLTPDTIEDVHVRLCAIYATKNLNSRGLSQIGADLEQNLS